MIIVYEQTEFIDRNGELNFLRKAYESDRAEFIVIYGRRRIGKTELVKHSLAGHKSVYFLADEAEDKENRKRFRKLIARATNNPLMEKAELNWDEIFLQIDENMVIVIDEFPYLIGKNRAIPSIFQGIWDEHLKKTKIKLILTGSSISMMETHVLGYKSPLYGRRTGQIALAPLEFSDVCKFFPDKKQEEVVRIYGITDGIPAYIQEARYRLRNGEKLEDIFLPNRPLFEEADFLLKTELREPARYYAILRAIAFSNTKFGEIVNFTGLPASSVSQYLSNLKTLHIVKEEYPYGEKETKRKARYYLADNYFDFYFRFIYEYKSELSETGKIPDFEEKYNTYLGKVFEKVGTEFVRRMISKGEINGKGAGRWWKKDIEIDIVSEGEDRTYFFEVKWSDMGLKDALRTLSSLEKKSEEYDFIGEKVYGIIAKRLRNKEKLREKGYMAYDLEDMVSKL